MKMVVDPQLVGNPNPIDHVAPMEGFIHVKRKQKTKKATRHVYGRPIHTRRSNPTSAPLNRTGHPVVPPMVPLMQVLQENSFIPDDASDSILEEPVPNINRFENLADLGDDELEEMSLVCRNLRV